MVATIHLLATLSDIRFALIIQLRIEDKLGRIHENGCKICSDKFFIFKKESQALECCRMHSFSQCLKGFQKLAPLTHELILNRICLSLTGLDNIVNIVKVNRKSSCGFIKRISNAGYSQSIDTHLSSFFFLLGIKTH